MTAEGDEVSADYSPTWVGGKLYFLSGRKGPITIYSYEPGSKSVSEVLAYSTEMILLRPRESIPLS